MPETSFQVGDIVRCINMAGNSRYIGELALVTNVDDPYLITVQWYNSTLEGSQYFPHRFEHINPPRINLTPEARPSNTLASRYNKDTSRSGFARFQDRFR